MSDARFVVWDPRNSEEVATVDLTLRPVVSDSEDAVLIGIEQAPADDVVIRPEWAGMKLAIQVSPSAVRADPLTAEIVRLASEMKVPVG